MIPTLDQVNVLHRAARLEEAEGGYREILAAEPDDSGALHGLGLLLLQTGRAKEAVGYLNSALDKHPDEPSLLNVLGATKLQMGDVGGAQSLFEAAVDRRPGDVSALVNLGSTQLQLGDVATAVETLQKARRIDPTNVDVLYNLSRALRALGQFDEARQLADGAVEERLRARANPSLLADAYHNLAQIDLQTGRLAEGWHNFDWRMQTPGFRGADSFRSLPQWKGEVLSDAELLIWTEQGPGDEILYSSMIADVEGRTPQTVIACTARLVPLFTRSFPFADVVPQETLLDDPSRLDRFSMQIAAGSLGQFFRTTTTSFPARPSFLIADRVQTEKLKHRYSQRTSSKPLIGVSWRSGNPQFGTTKSISVRDLAGPLAQAQATFVDLQYGDMVDDRRAAADAGLTLLHDHDVDPLKDLDAFAAQVAAMDLVITVSNTTAHVAGALGVPCWTLVSAGAGQFWYWFLDRSDSPWYPSMRLFRQATPGEWGGVLDRLETALARWTP